ncbi:uncharacterized protein PHACADRAFT_84901, partial [Phanerochaete carnosa HHB-10118-sp]
GLAVFEYLILLDQEVVAVWRRKFTATSLLLLAFRWVMVLGPLVNIVPSYAQVWCEYVDIREWPETGLMMPFYRRTLYFPEKLSLIYHCI